ASIPALRGAEQPPLFCSSRRYRTLGCSAARRAATCGVESVEQSSTTMISTLRRVCRRTESTAVGSRAASLYTMTTTLMSGATAATSDAEVSLGTTRPHYLLGLDPRT